MKSLLWWTSGWMSAGALLEYMACDNERALILLVFALFFGLGAWREKI